MSNYERLYKELKSEFLESKNKYEEIISQYKSSMQTLSENNERLKNDKHSVTNELSQLKQEYTKHQTDSLHFKEKTIEKLKDLEFLNIQYDKLKKEYERLKDSQSDSSTQASNSNTKHIIDELKKKLNSTLEENINLQSDYENYKNAIEETLQRKEEELEEAKNDILSKDKMIIQITKHRDFLVTTLYTAQDNFNDNDNSGLLQHPLNKNHNQNDSTNAIKSIYKKMPDKMIDIYSKSFIDNDGQLNASEFLRNQSKEDFGSEPKNKKYSEDQLTMKTANANYQSNPVNNQESTENLFLNKKISATMFKWYKERELKGSIDDQGGDLSNVNDFDGDEDRDFIQNKMAIELNSILEERRNYIINTMTFENYSFDIIANNPSGPGRQTHLNNQTNSNNTGGSNGFNSTLKGMKEQKLAEYIDQIIINIQQKKEKLINQKKIVETKLDKQGVKYS